MTQLKNYWLKPRRKLKQVELKKCVFKDRGISKLLSLFDESDRKIFNWTVSFHVIQTKNAKKTNTLDSEHGELNQSCCSGDRRLGRSPQVYFEKISGIFGLLRHQFKKKNDSYETQYSSKSKNLRLPPCWKKSSPFFWKKLSMILVSNQNY